MVSPYLNLATDGTDLGADLATITALTAIAASGDRRNATETRYSAGWFTYAGVNRAQYPRTLLNTDTFPTRTGTLRQVSGDTAFRAALTAAVPGDWIVVDHTVTYTGNYFGAFPVKSGDAAPGGNNVIVVISKAIYDSIDGITGLPTVCPPKRRVTSTDLASLAYFKCTNTLGAFLVSGPTSGWRFVGLRFGVDSSVASVSHLVSLGNGDTAAQNSVSLCPSNLGLDRCWIDAHAGCETRHACELHCKNGFVIDCGWGPDIHVSTYAESHAICGYNGPGPFRIVNNGVAGGSQSIFFGGANSPCGMPADIEARYNTFTRPPSWYGGPNKVKCGFEIKKAQFVLFEGNILENVWPQSQAGAAFLLKSESYGDGSRIGYTSDVIVRWNLVRNVAFGVNIAGVSNVDPGYPPNRVISFSNLYRVGGGIYNASANPFVGAYLSTDSGTIHDTFVSEGTVKAVATPGPGLATGFLLLDSIFGATTYGLKGSGVAEGSATIAAFMPSSTVSKSVFTGRTAGVYPAGSYFPADETVIQYTDAAAKDYSLSGTTQTGGGAVTPVATSLEIVTPPSGSESGVALTTQPVVRVLDQFGNPISSTATITATSDDAGVSDTNNAVAAVGGTATFANLTLTADGGVTTATAVTFSSPGLTSVTSGSVSVVVPVATAVATALDIVTPPAGAVSGVPLVTQPVVRVLDQYANPITWAGTITAAVVTTGPVTLTAGGSATAAGGTATFSGLTLTTTQDYHAALTFSAPGLTSVTSDYLVVAAAAAPAPSTDPAPVPEPPTPPTSDPVPAALVVTRAPGPAARLYSGRRFPQQPIVEARDENDALMTSFAGNVTAYLESGSGTLKGTATVQAVGGVARWTDLAIAGSGDAVLGFTDGPYDGSA